jgi:hypothetical protein
LNPGNSEPPRDFLDRHPIGQVFPQHFARVGRIEHAGHCELLVNFLIVHVDGIQALESEGQTPAFVDPLQDTSRRGEAPEGVGGERIAPTRKSYPIAAIR